MLEYWNIGRMRFGKMREWFIEKAILRKYKANEKIAVILSLLRRFYIIPSFHLSIIPAQIVNSDSAKTTLFQITCTNSETLFITDKPYPA
jgi:hypothetical protein